MTGPRQRIASTPHSDLLIEDEPHASSESGVRPVCLSDELDRAFEKLESGAPPRGLVGAEDPLAQIESNALLRQLAFEQLRALRERMDELAAVPTASRWIDAVRPLLASLHTVMAALEQVTLTTLLREIDFCFAQASELAVVGIVEGPVREALLWTHARFVAECSCVLDLPSEGR